MSEYGDRHTVARLFGSPPGYVGYDEGGQLTNRIWERPCSLVLLDEFEKAHPDVRRAFLQVFDAGVLTDGQGRKVSFSQATIVLTANVSADGSAHKAIGFSSRSDADGESAAGAEYARQTVAAVKEVFEPELIGRLDDIVVFRPLEREDARRIIDLEVARIQRLVQDAANVQEIDLDESVYEEILVKADLEHLGAREIKHLVDRAVRDSLSENWEEVAYASSLVLTVRNGRFRWNRR
jgi:ATP-dependent Clp protease ATP-binding subunit ClpC